MHQRTLNGWQFDSSASTACKRGTGGRRGTLEPRAVTDDLLVGRHEELAQLRVRLAASRLLTLVGPAGVGKTRLALALADEMASAFARRPVVVDVGAVTPARLPAVVGLAVGVRAHTFSTVTGPVRRHERLVVLDSCERFPEACASLMRALLRGQPGVRVIATAEHRLGLGCETVWLVPPLSLPEPDQVLPDCYVGSDAVQLFCDRAARVRRGFLPTEETIPLVAEICRRLDGLPLAIELAASLAGRLSLAEIAAGLDDALTVLDWATTSEGNRRVRNALESSWRRLSHSEQVLLRRLCVFADPFTLAEVAEICPEGQVEARDVVKLVLTLVDRSWLVADTSTAPSRYRMLEVMRQFVGHHVAGAGDLSRQGRTTPTTGVARGEGALTPAEQQVVTFAREGLTNREIAAELFISHRTVQTHLAHVYRKLGVSSRQALRATRHRVA